MPIADFLARRWKPILALVLLIVCAVCAVGIGLRFVPASARRLTVWRPNPEQYAVDAALLAQEMGRAPRIWEPASTSDIVVIVLDTTRLDRLGVYGYGGETTPNLDAWAQKARVYDQFRADGPWTLPSHASLFTGKWPIAHGAHGVPLSVEAEAAPLRKGSATVARALRKAGYRTVGIAANKAFLDTGWGLSQGFDVWMCEDLPKGADGTIDPTADRITHLAQAALGGPREGGMFLFLNYIDPHTPWHLREGYVKNPSKILRDSLPGHRGWGRVTDRLMLRHKVSPEIVDSWSEAYDGEIRFMDEQLGALFDALPSLGIDDNDYVFVLSDHGEYLGEHDLVEHSKDVYEQVIHVPLLIRGPGFTPGRDAAPLQHHDLPRLILAAAGLPPLPDSADTGTAGVQVTESYYARKREGESPAVSAKFDRIRRAFVQFPHALILGGDGTSEAYDLALDPEQRSVVPAAAWVQGLESVAAGWEAGQKVAEPAPMEAPVNTEALRALGYID